MGDNDVSFDDDPVQDNAMTSPAPPLRVAVAGLGFGRKVIVPALRATASTTVTALWHPDRQKVTAAAQAEEVQGFCEFSALLDGDHVDAVVIASPPMVRADLARQAMAAGKPVFLEKPVALSAAEARQLRIQALQNQLVCGVDFEYRAVPLFQQLAGLVQQGVLGQPWLVKLDWLMSSRADPGRPWSWYARRDQGGGVVGALGVHAFDLLAWLFGPVASVQAKLSTAITARPDPASGWLRNCDAEDVALIQLTFARGAVAQVNLSSVTRNGRGMWLELYGSDAQVVLGSSNQKDYVHGFTMQVARHGGPPETRAEESTHGFARTWPDGRIAPVSRLLDRWAAAVREGRPMVPGLAEGLASQVVADAVQKASATAMAVEIA